MIVAEVPRWKSVVEAEKISAVTAKPNPTHP
jgi:hypothetical protein